MENIWINPNYKDEKNEIIDLSEKALKDSEALPTPIKEVLDLETKNYIDKRFPKTNDDTLQEDIAQKFITDSNYLDTLYNNKDEGEKINKEIEEAVQNEFQEKNQLEYSLEAYKEAYAEVSKLIDELRILELRSKLTDKFPLVKSGISNREAFALVSEDMEKIKKELANINDPNISSLSAGDVLDRLKEASKRQRTLMHVLEQENPEMN